MSEQTFLILGRRVAAGSQALQALLHDIHGSAERPRCMCVEGGIDMYVARHGYYVIKRMPGTGHLHHPSCDAYEADGSLSGMGSLMGDAVVEHSPELVELRLNFPLTLRRGRAIPRGEPGAPGPVKAERHALSLGGLLHYLWDRAGFNRWSPAMMGKRNQQVLHKYLSQAAGEIQTKGVRLAQRLLVPEAFSEPQRERQFDARRRALAQLYQSGPDEQQLALVIGEFKEVKENAGSRRVLLKHLPDLPLLVQDKAWKRIEQQYGSLFAATSLDLPQRPRLVVAALIYARHEHAFEIDTACCMLTSAQWIPLEGPHEIELIETLTARGRRFLKPLRFDAPNAGAFANALLLDTADPPTQLHVISAFMGERERAAKEKLVEAQPDLWVWNTGEPLPPLPPLVHWRDQAGGLTQPAPRANA